MTAFRWESARDFATAYRSADTTPTAVATRLLSFVQRSEQLDPPMRFFIAQQADDVLAQARASTDRFAKGQPLGPWDGVPVAVKDELDQVPYATTLGTNFLGTSAASKDATVIARMRATGALLIGKANMSEIGLSTTGINPQHGATPNPHDPHRITGGSSSASASLVAAGLCPMAIGADGGGSVRIPASLCGVVGLKPTYGRLSLHGAGPLCWSVAHIGPLANCVHDAASALQVMAGPDNLDPNTTTQPALRLPASAAPSTKQSQQSLRGVRFGWCARWAEEADPAVQQLCHEAANQVESFGATLKDVEIGSLEHVRAVQYVTIGVEIAASQAEHCDRAGGSYGADTRMLLQLARRLPAVDYVRAQRLRSQIRQSFAEALENVDVLLTPTTASTATPLRASACRTGEHDDATLRKLTAFSFPANLLGLPALSLPVGYSQDGLPVGLQIMARWWDEALIVRSAHLLERLFAPLAPIVHYRLLKI